MISNKELYSVVESLDDWCVVDEFKGILYRDLEFRNCVDYVESNCCCGKVLFIVSAGDL